MAKAARVLFLGAERDPCLFYEECGIPPIGPGQVLAKIKLASICASDLQTINGDKNEAAPSVLGHEALAEVVEVKGHPSPNLHPGDRITFSMYNACGDCVTCRNKLPQKCENIRKYGDLPMSDNYGFTGCFSTHIILDSGTAIYKLPRDLLDRVATPINFAVATMVNAVSCIPDDGSSSVVIIQGAGLLGLYGCSLLKERGITAYCTDEDRNRLFLVGQFGGIPFGKVIANLGDGPVEGGVDAVIEVCGNPQMSNDGIRYLRPGGLYIFVGLAQDGCYMQLTPELLIQKCLTVKGVQDYAPWHLKEAVEFISRTAKKYPYDSLLSPECPLKEFQTAIEVAKTQRYHRVVFKP